jgi:hypothetical protein
VRSPIYKFAPDSRSDITPSFWALIGRVWDANGWKQSSEMQRAQGLDGDYDIAEARLCPPGYVLHLHALEGYLKRVMRQSAEYAQQMLDICYQRQPENLFYKVLAQDEARDEDIERYISICENWVGPKYTWLWETEHIGEKIANGDACGWDLVFMGMLIQKYRGDV